MVSAITTSVSGLTAAARRVEAAAGNLAGQNSPRAPAKGERADASSVPQPVDPVSLSPAGMQAQAKDTDAAREMMAMKIASYDYKANIRALQVQQKTEDSLLDMLS